MGGVGALLPKTLTLFKTKSCYFPYPIWPDQNFDNLFIIIVADTVSLNILYEGLRVYAESVIDKHEKEAFSKK